MAAIHLPHLPDHVLAALRKRAAAHRRPVEDEVIAILENAAESPPNASEPIRLVMATEASDADWSREAIYGDDGR